MIRSKFSLVAILATVGACAHAVSFGTTAVVDGISYTINASGSPVQTIGNTLSFSLPQAFVLSGVKTVTLNYSVLAAPGLVLDKARQTSNILAAGSSTAKFDTVFVQSPISENTSSTFSGTATPTFDYSFTNKLPQWSNVTTTITLTASGGMSKASIYNVQYTEVVPEPLSLATMAAGLIGLATRRRKK